MPSSPSTFPSTPAALTRLIDDCATADLSLRELAQRHDISVEALCAFMHSDAGAAQLNAIYAAAILRARIAAAAHLPLVVDALAWMLTAHSAQTSRDLPPQTPRAAALRQHARENARKAAALLLRIATLLPRPLTSQLISPPAHSPAHPPANSPATLQNNPHINPHAVSAESAPPRAEFPLTGVPVSRTSDAQPEHESTAPTAPVARVALGVQVAPIAPIPPHPDPASRLGQSPLTQPITGPASTAAAARCTTPEPAPAAESG